MTKLVDCHWLLQGEFTSAAVTYMLLKIGVIEPSDPTEDNKTRLTRLDDFMEMRKAAKPVPEPVTDEHSDPEPGYITDDY